VTGVQTCALPIYALDDPASAQAGAEEALRIAEQLGDADLEGWAAGALLFTAFIQGRRERVGDLSRSMLETGRPAGMTAFAMHYTCLHLLEQDRFDEVIEVGEAAVTICREAGDLFTRGMVLNSLAEARRRRGELTEAEALARQGVVCKHGLDDRRGVAALIETLAWIASDQRDDVRAAALLGGATSLRDSMAIPLLAPYAARHDACEQGLRGRLGEAAFGQAFRKGAAMSPGGAVDHALGRTEPLTKQTQAKSPTGLSRRELEIARLIADCPTNRDIASRLFISNRTVETHVTNMLNKLGLSSRTQLARWVG